MISPLGRGHRVGTLSITSSRGSCSRSNSGAHSRALGPAPTAALEGPAAAEGPKAAMSEVEDPAEVGDGLAAGGKGPSAPAA